MLSEKVFWLLPLCVTLLSGAFSSHAQHQNPIDGALVAEARPGSKFSNVPQEEASPERPQAVDSAKTFAFGKGITLHVSGKELRITNASGKEMARNPQLLRLMDEGGDCPSDGFSNISVKGDFFTVEQQACGGWYFINEYLTFRYYAATGRFLLHKAGYLFTDRRDPDRNIPQKTLTVKDFGREDFESADADALIAKLR